MPVSLSCTLTSPTAVENIVCTQEVLKVERKETWESMSLAELLILSVIHTRILKAYYESDSLLSRANTEISEVTGPVRKGLTTYTYIFHQKTCKNVCNFMVRKSFLKIPIRNSHLYP